MTHTERYDLEAALTPVCEGGDPRQIMQVMDSNFHRLHSARSVFCVNDPKYERQILPLSQCFEAKAHLISFLRSRRIMTVKNMGEPGEFRYTYTISFDTNFPSYLRRRCQGKALPEVDQALTACLRFLTPHRSGVDIMPYLFENSAQIETPDVRETIRAFLQFRFADEETLSEKGQIVAAVSENELNETLEGVLTMLRGDDWRQIASHARQNWIIAYIVLVSASTIHFEYFQKSAAYRLNQLLEFLDTEVGFFAQQEVFAAHSFFERGANQRFFRHLQANGKNLLTKLKNMAWDLAHPRNTLSVGSSVARTHKSHADFLVPYFLTFDQPAAELYKGMQANGLITYNDDGIKYMVIYPPEVQNSMHAALSGRSDALFEPHRVEARLKLGSRFVRDSEYQSTIVTRVEEMLLKELSAAG